MTAVRFALAIWACQCLLSAQSRPRKAAPKRPPAVKPAAETVPAEIRQVRAWMSAMTPRERIAQLMIVPFYGDNPNARSKAYRNFVLEVQQLRVGGMILINRVNNGLSVNAEPTAVTAFLNRMQKLARVPLIVGADFERGASMRVSGTAKFPHSMAFAAANDIAASRELGAATARESRALGVHWVFAPVADVNNNPDNPIINIRSYSEDPNVVSEHVKAYVQGAHENQQHKVLVTVKHFPGHGDTSVDTHLGLAKVEADKPRLEAMELVPFRAAIAAGVDSVMSAHIWVPAVEPKELPATVSNAVLTGLLRKELNFQGIVSTDAMGMFGIAKQFSPGEAAVRAIQAGADVVLMPANPSQAIRGVAAAVQSGRLTQKRIDESVEKLLRAKVRLGLHLKRLVDVETVNDQLSTDEDVQLAQRVAERAVTIVRNEDGVVPLSAPETACWFALTESRYGQQGRQWMEFLSTRLPAAKRQLVDPLMPNIELEEVAKAASGCSAYVIAAFAGFSGAGTLPENFANFVKTLQADGKPLILVGMGNPYLLRANPGVKAFLATFSTVPASEVAAVKALVGDIRIEGKLPVSIPGVAKVGDGLKVAAKAGRNLTEGSDVR